MPLMREYTVKSSPGCIHEDRKSEYQEVVVLAITRFIRHVRPNA